MKTIYIFSITRFLRYFLEFSGKEFTHSVYKNHPELRELNGKEMHFSNTRVFAYPSPNLAISKEWCIERVVPC